MGMYTDLLANATAWDAGGHDEISIGPDRIITQEIERLRDKGDVPYPIDCAETAEVQQIEKYTGSVSGGNFTLAFTLADGTAWTTTNLEYNANESIIQTEINDTADGTVPGWAHGDIVCVCGSGDNMTSDPLVITFSGDSVKGADHPLIVINDVDLSGGGTVGTVSETTAGQSDRPALGVCTELGIVTAVPAQGSVAGLVANANREAKPMIPSQATLQALAQQAAMDDANEELYIELMKAFGLQRLL